MEKIRLKSVKVFKFLIKGKYFFAGFLHKTFKML